MRPQFDSSKVSRTKNFSSYVIKLGPTIRQDGPGMFSGYSMIMHREPCYWVAGWTLVRGKKTKWRRGKASVHVPKPWDALRWRNAQKERE